MNGKIIMDFMNGEEKTFEFTGLDGKSVLVATIEPTTLVDPITDNNMENNEVRVELEPLVPKLEQVSGDLILSEKRITKYYNIGNIGDGNSNHVKAYPRYYSMVR